MKKEWWIQRGTNTWTEDEGLGGQDFYDAVREYEFKNSIHVVDYGAIAEKDAEIFKLSCEMANIIHRSKHLFTECLHLIEKQNTAQATYLWVQIQKYLYDRE